MIFTADLRFESEDAAFEWAEAVEDLFEKRDIRVLPYAQAKRLYVASKEAR